MKQIKTDQLKSMLRYIISSFANVQRKTLVPIDKSGRALIAVIKREKYLHLWNADFRKIHR